MYESDPDNFIRDIANYPQESVSKYFRNNTMLYRAISRGRRNPFNFYTHEFDLKLVANNSNNRYMHFDLSLGGDLCCFAMGYADGFLEVKKLKDGMISSMKLPYVVIDFVGIMLVDRNEEVWLPEIPNLIDTLHSRGFNLNLITFDRFQSAYLMQSLRDDGFLTSNLSIDKTANYPVIDLNRDERIARKSTEGNYIAGIASLKDAVNQGRISIPFHENIDSSTNETEFELEAKAAEYNSTKKKVDHPVGNRIDLVQAIAGVVFNIENNERSSSIVDRDLKQVEDHFYRKLDKEQQKPYQTIGGIDDFAKPSWEVSHESSYLD